VFVWLSISWSVGRLADWSVAHFIVGRSALDLSVGLMNGSFDVRSIGRSVDCFDGRSVDRLVQMHFLVSRLVKSPSSLRHTHGQLVGWLVAWLLGSVT
jgi:hypothetical protein